jgi:hypothetical protein
VKSALVKCADDTLGAPQRPRSLGNISIEREGHDQIKLHHAAGAGTAIRTILQFFCLPRVQAVSIHPCKAVVLYSCCENEYNSCPEEMSPVVVSL